MKQIAISERTVFMDANGVRALRGIPAHQLNSMIERGELLWVFNLSFSERHTNLRFLAQEVNDADSMRHLTLSTVIERILPVSCKWFHAGDISQRFLVSRQSVWRLGLELRGKLKGRHLWLPRAALAEYLSQRWLGAETMRGEGLGL